MLVRLLRAENRDICVNFVIPVMKTSFSYSSFAFRIANTSRYTEVHPSWASVFHECCKGKSYSSMSTQTCRPVFSKAAMIMALRRSESWAVDFGVIPYFFSYSSKRISRYEMMPSAVAPPRLISRRITGYCFQSYSRSMIFRPSKSSLRPSRYD